MLALGDQTSHQLAIVVVVFVVVIVVVDVVVVVTTPRSGSFPYFRTVRGVLPAKDNGSYADPPFEAPLSRSIFTLPSTLPTLPSC